MGNAIFQGLPAPESLNRFSKKFAELITSVTPPNMQKFGPVGPKGACLRMCENFHRQASIFLGFFSFMLIATGPPVGSILPLMA